MNSMKIVLLSFVFLMISMLCSSEISKVQLKRQQEITQQLDAYMQALTQLNRFSGSVVVAKGDTILLNKGYGLANHEFEVPNNFQTKFKICSIAKMFTATAVMQLQEQGLLNVHDTIDKYLPDYSRGNEIAIHHLLTHTAGISSANFPLEMVVYPKTLEQVITFYKNKPLEFDPGADYCYSNGGYSLLSSIIEKVTDKKYESYVKENILIPAGMHDSAFDEYDYAVLKNCASGYCFNQANNVVNGHYIYGSGLCCTAHDLYKFARALSTGLLINQDSLKSMCTPHHNQENYGYGCSIQQQLGHKLIEHGGMLSSGFKTNVSMFVDDELYIVILGNNFSAWVNEARDALASIMFSLPYDMPSSTIIKIDPALCDGYVGVYDHPSYTSGLMVERRGNKLYIPGNIELYPVATDQFMVLNRHADNMVYTFTRDEKGNIVQLKIKGGAPYFEIRCDKIRES